MYQSRDWNWLCEKRTRFDKADNFIKKIHIEVDRAHQFLYIINDTLQKCLGVGYLFDEDERPEHDITLVFQTYDDVKFPIGYADKGFYFLDSKFIYKRYCHFSEKNLEIRKDEFFTYCGMAEYYSSLFRLGILKPYGKSNCQTAHCGRHEPHFDFGASVSPIVQSGRQPHTITSATARCRSLV